MLLLRRSQVQPLQQSPFFFDNRFVLEITDIGGSTLGLGLEIRSLVGVLLLLADHFGVVQSLLHGLRNHVDFERPQSFVRRNSLQVVSLEGQSLSVALLWTFREHTKLDVAHESVQFDQGFGGNYLPDNGLLRLD